MKKLTGLFPDRLDDLGMAMTGVGHTDTSREVEIGVPFCVVNETTFSALGDDIGVTIPNW
jgi:hypothetical protein